MQLKVISEHFIEYQDGPNSTEQEKIMKVVLIGEEVKTENWNK